VLKLDIARAKTIARERELAAAKTASPAIVASAPAASTRNARKKAKKD
jgi:large subunit ribosomal protein L29